MKFLFATILATAALSAAGKNLEIHFVDVEGGQATLIVTPQGGSLLVDAGWPGFDGRDAKRIVEAAKKAGLKRIDFLAITHYHRDHVGGVEQLADMFPVGTFVDHGPNTESGKAADELSQSYMKAANKGKHLIVKPGDRIPVKGADIRVVTARGEQIAKPLPGGGGANPLCASAERKAADPTENARSLGFVLRFGKFSFIDLGDLTWNKEIDLVCPENRIGKVDVYLTTHHGMDASGPATIVHALQPRVAIMNNGHRKGGAPPAWKVIKASPGLEDLWQVDLAIGGGKETNVDESMIANLKDDTGFGLTLTAQSNGAFTVTNQRTGTSKTYAAR
jgi:beta-lactamase superfamily II metal-dependent hydrolase